jgi:branched-chain amino acid transport system permease protein
MAGAAAAPRSPELRVSLSDPRFVLIVAGALALAALPILAFEFNQIYLISLVSRMLIFAIAAVSLDLILGYGGMVSFGHAAYIGLGAYGVAVWSKYGIDNGYLQLVSAVGGSALVALFIGAVSLRTSGIYFIMITLAFTQMLYYLGISLQPFGGDDGMNTKRSDFGFFTLNDNILGPKTGQRDGMTIYYASLIALFASVAILRRLVNSRFGMVIRGSYSNPVRMQAIGFPILRYRLTAFVISGAICGVAGFLFANHQQFLSPVFMSWLRSGEIMVMVILGGIGTIYGSVIGAIGLLTLEELLETLAGKDYWMMVLGILLVMLAFFAKRGIWSLLPATLDKVPRFLAGAGAVTAALVAYVWLMSVVPKIKFAWGGKTVAVSPLWLIFLTVACVFAMRAWIELRAERRERAGAAGTGAKGATGG